MYIAITKEKGKRKSVNWFKPPSTYLSTYLSGHAPQPRSGDLSSWHAQLMNLPLPLLIIARDRVDCSDDEIMGVWCLFCSGSTYWIEVCRIICSYDNVCAHLSQQIMMVRVSLQCAHLCISLPAFGAQIEVNSMETTGVWVELGLGQGFTTNFTVRTVGNFWGKNHGFWFLWLLWNFSPQKLGGIASIGSTSEQSTKIIFSTILRKFLPRKFPLKKCPAICYYRIIPF